MTKLQPYFNQCYGICLCTRHVSIHWYVVESMQLKKGGLQRNLTMHQEIVIDFQF